MVASANYQVEIKDRFVLVSITLSGNYQTEFYVGDNFNYNELGITAWWIDGGATELLEDDCDINSENVDMNVPGVYTIYVSYTYEGITATTSYDIQVMPAPVTYDSLTLSGNQRKTFHLNEEFTYDGLVVTANYSDGTSKIVDNYTVSSPNMSTIGTKTITVTYTEDNITHTATYKILVKPDFNPELYILESITLEGKHPTTFKCGSEFSYEGLVVVAHYSGKKADQVVEDFKVDYSQVNMRRPGTYEVVVSYKEKNITVTASYTIEVLPKGIRDPLF